MRRVNRANDEKAAGGSGGRSIILLRVPFPHTASLSPLKQENNVVICRETTNNRATKINLGQGTNPRVGGILSLIKREIISYM